MHVPILSVVAVMAPLLERTSTPLLDMPVPLVLSAFGRVTVVGAPGDTLTVELNCGVTPLGVFIDTCTGPGSLVVRSTFMSSWLLGLSGNARKKFRPTEVGVAEKVKNNVSIYLLLVYCLSTRSFYII